jgi:glycerol kinase
VCNTVLQASSKIASLVGLFAGSIAGQSEQSSLQVCPIANFNAINSAEALVEDTKWETNVSDLKDRYEEAYFDKVFKGNMSEEVRTKLLTGWHEAVERTLTRR